jgi:hypothetical protein
MGSPLARALLSAVLLSGLVACPGGRELPADKKVVCTNCYPDWGNVDWGRSADLHRDLRRDVTPQKQDTFDPTCAWDNCGHCPAGWCGQNAECRNDVKCRCVGQWLNNHGAAVWTYGCDTFSPDCNPTNCNACSTGYCGNAANCNQNKCGCDSGYADCNSSWTDGCECHGTCGNCT